MLNDIIKGLQIINEVESDSWGLSAEHDVIYVGGDLSKYTPEQIAELEELGFMHDENYESFRRFV